MTLVLITSSGDLLGALPPFDVSRPWWPEVAEIVAGARAEYGVDVTVLRLLHADRPHPPGGAVTYLAEVAQRPALALVPAAVPLAAHPLRAGFAEVGGPARALQWASSRCTVNAAVQCKTWNLSSLWRLSTTDGTVWLKELPSFMRGETAVLSWLGEAVPRAAPALIAADGKGRQLLSHLPGEDRFGAPVADRVPMVTLLHTIQRRFLHTELPGLPDRRGALLPAQIVAVASAWLPEIFGLDKVLSALPDRLAALAGCGLPDTLVHGDFHPGNVRGLPLAILDWGDAFAGHPAFDILRMCDDLDEHDAELLIAHWARLWRDTVPGCDPERAVALLRPVAPLLGAAVYANFVHHIEPSEWPYHASDVPSCLKSAVGKFVVPL